MTYFQQLISCTDLHSILDRKDLVVLDGSIPPVGKMTVPVHSWPEYAIANARRFDLNQDFSDHTSDMPHTMPSEEQFERAAQALGINQQSQIVIYDDLGMFSAARAWYMFRAMGHKNVAVLDGGLPYWLSLNKPAASAQLEADSNSQPIEFDKSESNYIGGNEPVKNVVKGDFVARADVHYFCDWRTVEQQTVEQQRLILDARARERFYGITAEPRVGVRSGHMPNSKNLPYSELFNTSNGHGLLKAPEELAEIFNKINTEGKPMIMSCGSGVTACILALAAEISGSTQVCVYDGSWSEWGSLTHTRVEKD